MTMRTITKTVTFHRPFCLKGVDRELAPGDYRVVTDEELIEGSVILRLPSCVHSDLRPGAIRIGDRDGNHRPRGS